jgi:hypothetical protein
MGAMSLISNSLRLREVHRRLHPGAESSPSWSQRAASITRYDIIGMTAVSRERASRKAPKSDRYLQVRAADLLWIHDLALSASRPVRTKSSKLGEIPTNQWNRAACQAIVDLTSELLSTDRSNKSARVQSDTQHVPGSRRASQRKHRSETRRRPK